MLKGRVAVPEIETLAAIPNEVVSRPTIYKQRENRVVLFATRPRAISKFVSAPAYF